MNMQTVNSFLLDHITLLIFFKINTTYREQ